jgi:isochorismate hydrolase
MSHPIVLQIEHIDLKFNIKVSPFFALLHPSVRRGEVKGEVRMNPFGGMEREEAVLIIVDVQDLLIKQMNQEVRENVIRNIRTLITFAKKMSIPILMTEQYPKGLGKTVAEIKMELDSVLPIEKVSFSCCGEETFNGQFNPLSRKQVILTGIETHVCVLQTAKDLIQKGYEVHVVADAICSRKKLDWEIGLRWMEKRGAMISTTETIAFQLLKEAGTEEFRELSKLLK